VVSTAAVGDVRLRRRPDIPRRRVRRRAWTSWLRQGPVDVLPAPPTAEQWAQPCASSQVWPCPTVGQAWSFTARCTTWWPVLRYAVKPADEVGVDVGQVDCEDRVSLRHQQLSPRRVGTARADRRRQSWELPRPVEAAIAWPSPGCCREPFRSPPGVARRWRSADPAAVSRCGGGGAGGDGAPGGRRPRRIASEAWSGHMMRTAGWS